MSLPGGFVAGDRVLCKGCSATVLGAAVRVGCSKISVAVRYDDGRISDERIHGLVNASRSGVVSSPTPAAISPSAALASPASAAALRAAAPAGGPLVAAGSGIAGSPVAGESIFELARLSPALTTGPPELEACAQQSRALAALRDAAAAALDADSARDDGSLALQDRHAAVFAGCAAPPPTLEYGSLRRRLYQDAPPPAASAYVQDQLEAGHGHGMVLEDRHAPRPRGGELEANYGIGNRSLEDRYAPRPRGGEIEANYGIGNRILEDRYAHRPRGGEIEANYGIDNRSLEDRYAPRPRGGEIEAGYGIGNRILPDRHAVKRARGGLEAATGVSSRVMDNEIVVTGYGQGRDKVVETLPDLAAASGHSDADTDKAVAAFKAAVSRRFNTLAAAYRFMNRGRGAGLTQNDLAEAFTMHGVWLPPDQLEAVRQRFDRGCCGHISFTDFCSAMA